MYIVKLKIVGYIVLKKKGTWKLTCKESGAEMLKLIRKIFNHSLKQIADLKSQEAISFNGTFAEMSHLENLFKSHKLQVEMRRIS